MDMQRADAAANRAGPKRGRGRGKGRQDRSGQETVKDITKLNEDMAKLLKLRSALSDASTDYSEAVKKTAERSGFLASVVRRLADAKHGDKFDDVKRMVDQLGEAFELVG